VQDKLVWKVRAARITLAEAEQQVLDYIKQFVPDPRTAPLCGNSIGTDRGFIVRDMPELDAHLHYRMIDVSSIKELCRRWYPGSPWFRVSGDVVLAGHAASRAVA